MKKKINKITSLFLALALVFTMSIPTFATDSVITFNGMQEGFSTSGTLQHEDADLFGAFKDVMPGDKLTETIEIKNAATDCDYINLYMKAEAKDSASMKEFLAQLTMRVFNGETKIYEGSPDKTGALADYVSLGQLYNGESLKLKVEIDVPITMGNQYADRTGSVSWSFLAEGIQSNQLTVQNVWADNGYPDRPDSVVVHLLRDGEVQEDVILNAENQWSYVWTKLDDRHQWSVEEDVPQGYEASYETKDNIIFITNHMDYTAPVVEETETLTVEKVWNDKNDKRGKRPTAVTMTLYQNGKAVDKVTLNDANHWSYTWDDLDQDASWSVLETGNMHRYHPSYDVEGNVVTVTNTYEPAPITGDGSNLLGWGALLLAGIASVLFLAKKRKEEKAE